MPTSSTDSPHSPQAEHRHHAYVTNAIPWWVRAVWLGFWIFTIYYSIVYMFPAFQSEIERVAPAASAAKR
ncbi:MAG: hypothetical protein JNL96_25235 [Planctomycetaceae bacterium]|nr:hypothetical protein [Planctomycetaceae bacterium]